MKKIITSALLCLSFVSFAQQKELTLKEAIRYALENKADAEKARLEVTKANYKIQEVRANALPNISASGGMVYNPKLQATYIDASTFAFPGIPASDEPLKMEMGQKWSANAEAKLTQVLFNQSVFMGLKAARTTREFYNIIFSKLLIEHIELTGSQSLLSSISNPTNIGKYRK